MSLKPVYLALKQEINKVVFGQDQVVDFSLAALFSSGHILLEGVPGTAKTLLVKTIAASLSMDFKRVQMTPDMLPGDILGASIWREDTRTFEFKPGPIFTNFLLADEVNRTSAKTQSALLEGMQEYHVSQDGTSHPLPQPFLVFATQNPVEQEGTYPLPLAQLDRFMFKVVVDYPPAAEEERILKHHHGVDAVRDPAALGVKPILQAATIAKAREFIRNTFVRDEVIAYIQRLLSATREDDSLLVGASPRAGLMCLMGAKSLARFDDRDFVTPDDIKGTFIPAMRHRVVLSPAAELEGVSVDQVLATVMEMVEVPR